MATKRVKQKTNSRKAGVARPLAVQARSSFLIGRSSLLWIAAIFLLHGTALSMLFQPILGIFNSAPLIDQDWGLHFHHLQSMVAICRKDRHLWGYNPLFMAGYPSNTIQDLSIKFYEFFALGLSAVALTPVQWFKISAFLAMASVPWLMYFAARNYFFADDSRQSICLSAALLGTLYWWNSLPREMFFYGMIGFPVASYLCVWGMSLFYRLILQSQSLGPIQIGWLVFALVILPLHIQSVIIFLPAIAGVIAVQPLLINRRICGWLLAAAAVALIGNSVWLIPAFNHRGDDVSRAIVDQLPLFASTDPLTFVIDYVGAKGYWTFRASFAEKGFRVMLLILGGLGTWQLVRSERRALGIMLASVLATLFLIAYFGAFIPSIKAWQPLRFKVPYDLFLAIGAAYAIGQWLSRRGTTPTRFVPWLLCGALLVLAVNLLQTESTGKLQLRTQMKPEIDSIVQWIERETPVEARVLFEESGDESGFVYDGMYLSSFLPHVTGRQLIGGPINLYNDRHHFAEFHSGKLFKRDIQTLSDEELRNYFQLYNIGAVIAFHPASLKRLQSLAGLVSLDHRIGPVHLMKVHQPFSWFLQGDGKVAADLGRLKVSDVKERTIILKYHWVEGLRGVPAVRLLPVQMHDDPIPFVKIVDPPANFTLQVGE